jgi:hypothetical protein
LNHLNNYLKKEFFGEKTDKEAFVKFLKEAGILDTSKIETLWREDTFVTEFKKKPFKKEWVEVVSPDPTNCKLFFNEKTGELRFKLKGG